MPGFTFVASISAIVYARARRRSWPRSTRPSTSTRPTSRRGSRRGRGHPRRPHARRRRPGSRSSRRSPTGTASRSSRTAPRPSGRPTRAQGVGGIGTAGIYSFNEYKTITCGDGGMIVTDDEDLYTRAFAMHDQGHAPNRLGSKYAERPFLGMNFRMTELSGAVLLRPGPQAGPDPRSHLRANKADRQVGDARGLPGLDFRTLVDPEGDLATHLVVTFPTAGDRRRPWPTSSARSRSPHPAGTSTPNMEHLSSGGR